MNRDFQFRDKIAVALTEIDPLIQSALTPRIEAHPWLQLADHHSCQILVTGGQESTSAPHLSVIRLSRTTGPFLALDLNENLDKLRQPVDIALPSQLSLSLAVSLKPLLEQFGITSCLVSAMLPATSHLASMELLDNLVPATRDVVECLEKETTSLLNMPPSTLQVSGVHVPISHGALLSVSATLTEPATMNDLKNSWETYTGYAHRRELPSGSEKPLCYYSGPRDPQPRLHGHSSSISIGGFSMRSPTHIHFLAVAPSDASHIMMTLEALILSGLVYW